MIFGFLEKWRKQKIRLQIVRLMFETKTVVVTDLLTLEALTNYVYDGRINFEDLKRKFPSYKAWVEAHDELSI